MDEDQNITPEDFKGFFQSKKTIISLTALVLLLITILLGVYLVQIKQIFKSKASEKAIDIQNGQYYQYVDAVQSGIRRGLGAKRGDPKYKEEYDIDGDDQVTAKDGMYFRPIALSSRSVKEINEKQNILLDSSTTRGYIVEFKDEAVIEYQERIRKAGGVQVQSPDYEKNTLLPKHEEAKRDIFTRLGVSASASPSGVTSVRGSGEDGSGVIMDEYTKTFNGIALDIDKTQVEKIRQSPYVKEIYPNHFVKAFLADSIPIIKASDIWNSPIIHDSRGRSITGKGIKVGVLDTGVDYTHSDLGGCTEAQFLNRECGKVVGGYDFINRDNNPKDDNGHGTHVASIVAGNGSLKGVAPDAVLVAYKVLDDRGSGEENDIIAAIEKSVDPNNDGDFSDRLDVINLSLGGGGSPDHPLSQAVDRASIVGVTVVVAGGNSGPDDTTIGMPGVARKAITVGASNKSDKLAEFSSRGPVPQKITADYELLKPNVLAPGVDICAAQSSWSIFDSFCGGDERHVSLSGTSMATPHVAGVVALLKQLHPEWSPDIIKSTLVTTSVDLGGDFNAQGAGRVDVIRAASASAFFNPVSLNYGFVDRSVPRWQSTKRFTVKNVGTTTRDYIISTGRTNSPAIISLSESNFSLAPAESRTIDVALEVDNAVVSDGLYHGEIQVKEGNNLYRLPYLFFKKNIQIKSAPDPTNNISWTKVKTPYVELAQPPLLRYKFPSAVETERLMETPVYFFGNYLTQWIKGFIYTEEGANYMSIAPPELPGYNASTPVTVDKTPPVFTATASAALDGLSINIRPNEPLGEAFFTRFIDKRDDDLGVFGHWFPALYANGKDVYNIYHNYVQPPLARGFARKEFIESHDFGQTWSAPIKLAEVGGTPFTFSEVVMLSGRVLVFYQDQTGSNLLVQSREKDSESWSSPVVLATDSFVDRNMLAGVINDKVYLFYPACKEWVEWRDRWGQLRWSCSTIALQHKSSSDGIIWSTPFDIKVISSVDFRDFAMKVEGGEIRIVYLVNGEAGASGSVHYLKSSDGVTWEDKVVLRDSKYNADYVSLASSGQKIFFVWNANNHINLARSVDGGVTWKIGENITRARDSGFPKDWDSVLAFEGGKLYLATILNFFQGVTLRQSSDLGESWEERILDEDSTQSIAMASSAGVVYTVWSSAPAINSAWRENHASSHSISADLTFKDQKETVGLTKSGDSWVGKATLRGFGKYNLDVSGLDAAGNRGNSGVSLKINAPSCERVSEYIANAIWSSCGSSKYNKVADVNKDKMINGLDTSKIITTSEDLTNDSVCQAVLADTKDPCVTPSLTPTPTPPSGPSCTPCRADFDRSGTADRGDLTALQNSGCYGKPVTAVDKQGKPCIEWSLANKSTIGAYDFTCLKSLQGQRCLSGASALSSGTLPSQAAAYWKFDEGKGVLASNSGSLGSGLNMTLGCTPGNCTPSTWSEKGKAGKALNFDGVNDYGIVKDNPALKPDSSITVSAWFNTSDLTRNQRIVSKTENGGYQISLNENSACGKNTLCFLIRIGNGYKQAFVPVFQLSKNTWYYVAGTYDGSNVKFYLNGELKATTPATGKITHTTAPLCVGMEATASSCKGNPFIGIIDELKIYNRALNPGEIAGG